MKARQFTTLCSLVHQLSKSHFCAATRVRTVAQIASNKRSPFASYIRFSAAAPSILPPLSNAVETPSFASTECSHRQTLVTNVHHGIPKELALQISDRLHQSSWPGLRSIVDLRRTDEIVKCLPKHQHVGFVLSRASSSSSSEGRPDEQNAYQEDYDRQFWSLSEIPNVPLPALALGAAGLIPFVALAPPIDAFLPHALFYGMHVQAQASYGAVILTFLGAPHWGLAMADYAVPSEKKLSNITANSLRYLWSVVPSLLGWLALLLPPIPQFALLISSFGLVIGVDIAFSKMKLVPSWYLTLRVPLTTIAILSLTANLVVAVAGMFNG